MQHALEHVSIAIEVNINVDILLYIPHGESLSNPWQIGRFFYPAHSSINAQRSLEAVQKRWESSVSIFSFLAFSDILGGRVGRAVCSLKGRRTPETTQRTPVRAAAGRRASRHGDALSRRAAADRAELLANRAALGMWSGVGCNLSAVTAVFQILAKLGKFRQIPPTFC